MQLAARRWIRRLGLLVVLVAAAWLVRVTLLAPQPVQVETVAVERGRVEATLSNTKAGTVEARRRARLSPGTSGIVVELCVERGQRVGAGELLLRLEDSSQRAQRVEAQRALEVARAEQVRACIVADRAARELARNRELAADQIVSVDVLDRLESAHEQAAAECDVLAARVEQALARVAVTQAEVDKTELRSPFDAVVAEVSVELGEWVTPSVPLLAAPDVIDAIDTSSLYVSAPMDEVDAPRLAVGQRARVTLDPWPERSFPARVARIAPYVLDLEQQNRTVEIEVELEDSAFSATLLPGTSADVEVVLEVHSDALRLPASVLLAGDRVLVLVDGTLVERPIEVGLRNWDWVEVVGGLELGERVVGGLERAEVRAGAPAEEAPAGAAP
jgi:HlyD family secretion protein